MWVLKNQKPDLGFSGFLLHYYFLSQKSGFFRFTIFDFYWEIFWLLVDPASFRPRMVQQPRVIVEPQVLAGMVWRGDRDGAADQCPLPADYS